MMYQEINSRTVDRWCREDWEWGQPISHETYLDALRGRWDVYLTPVRPVPHEWFGELRGSTAWMVWKAPSTLTAKIRCQKSSVMS